MKLTDGFFAKLFRRAKQGVEDVLNVTVAEAEGVMFECPKCVGTDHAHAIRCWFSHRGLPASLEPLPRWEATGHSIEDLTLVPSIALPETQGALGHPMVCGWHGWVRKGHTVDA